jgi:hypothetical protein
MSLNLDSIPEHLRSDEQSFFHRLKYETEIHDVNCVRIKAEEAFVEWAKTEFKKLFEDSEEIIDSEFLLYRARIVYPPKIQLEPKDMGAPPYWKANRGRVQPEGVSFLYTATEVETALAEIRPNVGDKVAIGEFRIKDKRTLKILKINQRLSCADILDHENKSIRFTVLEKFLKASRFSLNHFSSPAKDGEQDVYKETIFIAHLIHEMGYDGLSYESACKPGSGVNYAFFSASHFICERVQHRTVENIEITSSMIPDRE